MATTVLIVDDSKLARIVIGKTINALRPEWERVEAGSAEAAMALLDQHQIDVALIDYNMPGKDGLHLVAELRALRPLMPIALITANIQDEIIARTRALSATFVSKPVTEDGMRGFVTGATLRLRMEDK